MPTTPSGLGAVTSTRSTACPPASTTVVIVAGRKLALTVLRKARTDRRYAARGRWAARSFPARSTKRSGTPALAPGPLFPNPTIVIGWCRASALSASSNLASTMPAESCSLASAGTVTCRSVSRPAPALFLSAWSLLSAVW